MSGISEYLDVVADAAADKCTACGRCVEVCPTRQIAGLSNDDAPMSIIEGLKGLTKGQKYGASSRSWIEVCNGNGECNLVCPEGINVRQWITISKLKLKCLTPEDERAKASAQQFRRMAQAVHLLASMQIPSDQLKKIQAPAKGRKSDLVFYYGCNVLRSPHIIFNVMDILESIEVDFQAFGGTANCCGVVQFMGGDVGTYERISGKTYDSFSAMGAKQVISWCPTCQLQFGEVYHNHANPAFGVENVTEFLARNADRIARKIVQPMRKRAVIHEHGGLPGVVEGTRKLMSLIPELEIVDVPQNRDFGYQCSRVAQYPEQQAEVHRTIAENAKTAGVDLIITIYHGCHRQLCGAEGQYPYEVLNFTDVLARALGGGRPDLYKAYKKGGDVHEAVRSAEEFLRQNGVRVAGHEELLTQEIFGEPGISRKPMLVAKTVSFST
jgi:Fe-S oxidoreductase